MAASTGRSGLGVTLQVSDGESPEVWSTVGNIANLSGGGVTVTVLDSTHLGSPDRYAEKLPGLKTASDWTGTVQYDPNDPTLDSTTGLRKFVEDGSLETFRINMTGVFAGFGIEVDAYVTELGNIEVSPTAIMTQSFTLSIVGKPREVAIA